MKKSIKITVIIIAILVSCGTNSETGRFCNVQKGEFHAAIMETGELKAVNSTAVITPIVQGFWEDAKVISLGKEGLQVKKGDIVAELDKAKIVQRLTQKKRELAIEESNLKKLKVKQEIELKELDADLLTNKADLKSARLQAEKEKFESQTRREISSIQLQVAEIAYNRFLQKIESVKIMHSEDLRINEMKIRQIKADIKQGERAIEAYTLHAPTNGMIEYGRNWNTGKKVQVGDQMWSGCPIIQLPDLSKMKVLTSVNEKDIGKIYKGQKVFVRLDAFPKKEFTGSIISISNISHKKDRESKLKIFDIVVLLDKVDRILKPGMTVSCEIIIAELDEVLFVDNDFIQEDGTEYFVYLEKDNKLQRTKVKLGPNNNKAVVIYGNLKAGDKIVLNEKTGEA